MTLTKTRRNEHRLMFALALIAAFFGKVALAVEGRASGIELEDAALGYERTWSADAFRAAVKLNLSASEAFRKEGEFERAAHCLRKAARLQAILGERSGALLTLRVAQELNPKLAPLGAIANLTLYSTSLIDNGKASESSVHIDKARRLTELTSDPAATGFVVKAMAEQKDKSGDFAAAEPDYEEAVRQFRLSDDGDRLARTLLLLAGVRIPLGEYSAGLENADEAARLFAKSGNVRETTFAKVIRGHLLGLVGEKQRALDEYLDAETKFPPDIDKMERARVLGGLGYIYSDLGDFRLSLIKRREACEIFEAEGDWLSLAYGLPLLVDLNFRLGDEQAALDYLKRSENLAVKTGYSLGLVMSNDFVGDHYFRRNEDDRAIAYFRRALPVAERSKLAYLTSSINDKLGSALMRKGLNGRARKHFNKALEQARQMDNFRLETNILYHLASLELDEGRIFRALELSQASIERTEKLSISVRNSRLRSSHFASVFERYELYIRILMRAAAETGDRKYTRQALQAAERSRARSMLENLALDGVDLIADATPETAARDKRLRDALNAASDNLTNLLNSGVASEILRKADEEIAALQNELEELRAELKRTSPAYSAIKDPPLFDIEGFQQNVLDENTALLEFSIGEKESFLWVTDNKEVSGFRLPPRSELSPKISSIIDGLRSREPRAGERIDEYQQRVSAKEEEYRAQACELSRILLEQAADKVRGKRLIIVADGPLHYLPFSALPFPGSEPDIPLLDSNEIVYQPSAHTLAVVSGRRPKEETGRRDLIVFSDPVFTADDDRLTGAEEPASDKPSIAGLRFVESLGSLTRLRGSGREAESIIGAIGSSSADLHSGFSATRRAFLEADLDLYRMLHLATHAMADGERPEITGVVLSGVGRDGSQLDQLIRLQDIYALKLNADLVVLSACETAAGKELRGEGLLSLNNAFIQAGSRSVVSTLWKVDEEASRILMGRFYQEIAAGQTPATALKQAQKALRSEPRFQSPFYWAAFTLHGDPNVRLRMSRSHSVYAIPVAIGIGSMLLLTVYWLKRRRPREQ